MSLKKKIDHKKEQMALDLEEIDKKYSKEVNQLKEEREKKLEDFTSKSQFSLGQLQDTLTNELTKTIKKKEKRDQQKTINL